MIQIVEYENDRTSYSYIRNLKIYVLRQLDKRVKIADRPQSDLKYSSGTVCRDHKVNKLCTIMIMALAWITHEISTYIMV
jgi:hypothetical protein